jgi:hypothetical protein
MRLSFLRFATMLLLPAWAVLATAPVRATDANAAMARVAAASPLFRQARGNVAQAIASLRDPALRRTTEAALLAPNDCIQHRIGLTAERQAQIMAALRSRGLIAGETTPSLNRLFPRVDGEGSGCPHLPEPVVTAPGGNSGSHHSWPGGLAVHLATNLASTGALAQSFGIHDTDRIVAAVLWHDWAKKMVLRWRSDGLTEAEIQVAGTGVHHVLGLAEAMGRGLDPRIIAAQACAHDPDPARVRRWIEAAALIAGRDPATYPAATSPECLVTHLADQNWVFGDAAVEAAEAALTAAAPAFGFDVGDEARHRLCFRNPVLARFGADALFVKPGTQGWAAALRLTEADCGRILPFQTRANQARHHPQRP